jgi:hypothetical protein
MDETEDISMQETQVNSLLDVALYNIHLDTLNETLTFRENELLKLNNMIQEYRKLERKFTENGKRNLSVPSHWEQE